MKKQVKKVKKIKVGASVPRTVRGMLNQIERFLLKRNDSASDLWCVLSALRGPDSEDSEQKSRQTIPIRCAAFPKLAAKLNKGNGPYIGASFSSFYRTYKAPTGAYGHFENHAREAAEVLKLK